MYICIRIYIIKKAMAIIIRIAIIVVVIRMMLIFPQTVSPKHGVLIVFIRDWTGRLAPPARGTILHEWWLPTRGSTLGVFCGFLLYDDSVGMMVTSLPFSFSRVCTSALPRASQAPPALSMHSSSTMSPHTAIQLTPRSGLQRTRGRWSGQP